MSTTCNTCAENPVCLDNLDRYSLQDDTYYFVFNCPPNFYCGGNNTIYLVCCDGTTMQQTFPQGITTARRNALLAELVGRCAKREAFCGGGGGGGGGGNGDGTDDPNNPRSGTDPNNPVMYYGNTPQTGTARCPDGSTFRYTVPAGVFYSSTQALANSAAYAYARTAANNFKVCLSGPTRLCCVDNPYVSKIQATGGQGTIRWSINGALPTGLVSTPISTKSLRISGTPSATGSYTFTVRAVDPIGAYMQKSITIVVWGITDTSLPDATTGTDYNHQLSVYGGTSPYTFAVVSGTFPIGIDMAGDGLITGTTTDTGDFTVNIKVTDAAGRFCVRELDMTVNASAPTYLVIDSATETWFESVSVAPYPALRRIPANAHPTVKYSWNNGKTLGLDYSQITFQDNTTYWVLQFFYQNPPFGIPVIALYRLLGSDPKGVYTPYPGYPNPVGSPLTVTVTYP